MSLFKIIDNEPESNAKIRNTDFKDFYSALNLNMAWKTVKPFIEQAEESYIIPYLSRAFYDEIESEYQNDDTIHADKAKAVKFIRTALAYYTVYYAMPHINIRIGDAGVQETSATDALPTRQWVYKGTRWDALNRAYENLDKALSFMEEKVALLSTEFDTFKSSDAYTITKELFIESASTLNDYFFINNSRRAYMSMRPYIKKSETLYIIPLLGESFVDELKTAFKANTLSANQSTLLGKIRPVLAEHAIQEATPEINLINEGQGWKVVETTDGMTITKESHRDNITGLLEKANANAVYFKSILEGYLYGNLDSFPTFRDSDFNKDKDDGTASDTDNDVIEDGGVFL